MEYSGRGFLLYLVLEDRYIMEVNMNIALIFAGGTGQRMNSKSRPKQFLEMHGKPILIHTLEYFETHKSIDSICVVCLAGWEDELKRQLVKYQIEKVKWIVEGGETGHDSIYNGLEALKKVCADDDIVLIHDGVRPIISEELITLNIETVERYGNSITVEDAAESVVVMEDRTNTIADMPRRHLCKVAKAPQCFYMKDICEVHELAKKDGFKAIDSSDLMHHYGRQLFTVKSTPYNIKIATPSDYYVFRAIYEARENSQVFGLQ